MKIATWNVNSLKARLEHTLKWLEYFKPDVALLQELKMEDDAFPVMELQAAGYNAAFHGQKTYNGVAILSPHEITDVHMGLPGDDADDQARYIEATINGVRVVSVYVPNGQAVGSDKYDYKLGFLKRLDARMTELLASEQPVVVGGDYNIALHPQDLYDPAKMAGDILYSVPEKEALRTILHKGYTDAYRALHPKEVAFSWWDYRSRGWERDIGFRIDHLMLSPEATDRLADCQIDKEPRSWEKPSDHTPVWCQLEI